MINRFSKNKIYKVLVIFLIVFLLYLFPKKEEYSLNVKTVMDENKYHDIFLIDKNNMVAKTKIVTTSNSKEGLIKELVESLIIDGKYVDRVPNGFTQMLPSDTKILNINVNNNIIDLNFNNKLFDVKSSDERKVLESIIYTLTSIKDVHGVRILIDGKILNKLPKTGELLDEVLNRKIGINKDYNIDDIKNITNVTIYYTSKFNDQIYYVPVTKYMNSNDNKIKIIIDQLTSRMSYNSNLISYLNSNLELLDYSFNEDQLDLNFNQFLFDNEDNKKVLEEVIYSISYSVEDTLNVSNIKFFVNNKEIKK